MRQKMKPQGKPAACEHLSAAGAFSMAFKTPAAHRWAACFYGTGKKTTVQARGTLPVRGKLFLEGIESFVITL